MLTTRHELACVLASCTPQPLLSGSSLASISAGHVSNSLHASRATVDALQPKRMSAAKRAALQEADNGPGPTAHRTYYLSRFDLPVELKGDPPPFRQQSVPV